MWADSSPQGGRDWLLAHSHSLKWTTAADALGLQKTLDTLWRSAQGFEAIADTVDASSSSDDDNVDRARTPTTRAELTCRMVVNFDYHNHIPVALGSRAGSLPHKMASLLHILKIESASAQHLDCVLESCVAITTDLGTEHGLADCSGAGFWSHFAEFSRPAMLAADTDAAHTAFEGPMDSAEQRSHLFEKAFPVAGLLHIVDNAAKDVLEQMVLWPSVQPHLNAVCDLLCKEHNRELFVQNCLVGHFPQFKPSFQNTFKQIKSSISAMKASAGKQPL